MKDSLFLEICTDEYQALIGMLEKAINICSDDLWNKQIDEPPFWQQVYHTIHYLDFYLGDDPEQHKKRFALKENLNEKYDQHLTKLELLEYLQETTKKCIDVLKAMTALKLEGENKYFWTGPTLAHKLIYNIRHSQHHIGRLNSILRRHLDKSSKWIITNKKK